MSVCSRRLRDAGAPRGLPTVANISTVGFPKPRFSEPPECGFSKQSVSPIPSTSAGGAQVIKELTFAGEASIAVYCRLLLVHSWCRLLKKEEQTYATRNPRKFRGAPRARTRSSRLTNCRVTLGSRRGKSRGIVGHEVERSTAARHPDCSQQTEQSVDLDHSPLFSLLSHAFPRLHFNLLLFIRIVQLADCPLFSTLAT
jgi:hypothetical protein